MHCVGESLIIKKVNVRLLESEEIAKLRKETNKCNMRRKRLFDVSSDNAIGMFLSKVKCGPDYVCTVRNRMLYESSVVLFNDSKYEDNVLKSVSHQTYKHTSVDNKEWICRSCHNAMCRGNVPVQAKANGLDLDVIPDELKDLNTLELRLISLRIPFMKMVALPTGKQRCIHGPAVNVPSKLDNVCTLLPRMPSKHL